MKESIEEIKEKLDEIVKKDLKDKPISCSPGFSFAAGECMADCETVQKYLEQISKESSPKQAMIQFVKDYVKSDYADEVFVFTVTQIFRHGLSQEESGEVIQELEKARKAYEQN